MTPEMQSRWPRSVLSRIDFACRAFVAIWTAISAIVLDSIALHAAALYMVAVMSLYHSPTSHRDTSPTDARPRPSSKIWLVAILLAPSPFLIGAGVHRLNHVQPLDPWVMLVAAIPGLVYGVSRLFLRPGSRSDVQTRHSLPASMMAPPFAAPALATVCLAAGIEEADAAICLLLILALLFGVLGQYMAQFGQMSD